MSNAEMRPPLQPGEQAPEFTLPRVSPDGSISLGDFRGKPLLLAIFVGLWCPFCRRAIAQLGGARDKLLAAGVETLGVVATEVENARLYFRYHPARFTLVADAQLVTHRAYGLPKPEVTNELMQAMQTVKVNPKGEFPEPLPLAEVGAVLNKKDGFVPNATDARDVERQWPMLKAQFLLDAQGIVRWNNVECAKEGLAGIGKFPSDEELLAAARLLN